MKKRLVILLLVLLVVSLACSTLGFGGNDSTPNNGGAGNSGDTNGNDDSDDSGGGIFQGGSAGPSKLDLESLAEVSINAFPAYSINMEIEYSGVDTSGVALTVPITIIVEAQTTPVNAQHTYITSLGEGSIEQTNEMVIIGDQMYMIIANRGCMTLPAGTDDENDPTSMVNDVNSSFTGEVNLVDKNVNINGVITDKYEINKENFVDPAAGDEYIDVSEGYLYVARDGGYVARVEFSGTMNTEVYGLDPTQPTDMSYVYDLTPLEEGSLNIQPPEGCDASPTGSEYPVMEGATDVFTMSGVVTYNVTAALSDVVEFYRTEMVNTGYTLDFESGMETMATMAFTKDGAIVTVSLVDNAGVISVIITQE